MDGLLSSAAGSQAERQASAGAAGAETSNASDGSSAESNGAKTDEQKAERKSKAARLPVAGYVVQREPFVLTVHNAGYQGHFGYEVMEEIGLPAALYHWKYLEWYDKVNFLKGGLAFSDYVTTVSPTHAHELRTRFGGFGLHEAFMSLQDHFVGILNGIDQSKWDPSDDPDIEAEYGLEDLSGKARCKAWLQEATGLPVNADTLLFGMTARLVYQKGIDLILQGDLIPESSLDAQGPAAVSLDTASEDLQS